MKKYRKKPVVIEAVQWTGDNFSELEEWVGKGKILRALGIDDLIIMTMEGDMFASLGDYIIKGIKDEFYPCKPDIFDLTYESV